MSLESRIKTYVEIDDELKRVADEVKILKSNKVALEEDISNQMVQHHIQELDCKDQTKVKVYTKKSSPNVFTKPNVIECAITLFGSDKTDELVNLIEERKRTKETTGIKRMAATRKRALPKSETQVESVTDAAVDEEDAF